MSILFSKKLIYYFQTLLYSVFLQNTPVYSLAVFKNNLDIDNAHTFSYNIYYIIIIRKCIDLKKHFQSASRVMALHFIFAIASFLFSKSFHWFLADDNQELILSRLVIYSLITSILYLSAVHSVMWDIGKKDNQEDAKPYIMKGLVLGLIVDIPSVILLLVSVFFPAGIIAGLYKFYQFTFWGFMAIGNGNLLSCFLVMLIEPIWCMIVYMLGLKKFDVAQIIKDKLVYRQK